MKESYTKSQTKKHIKKVLEGGLFCHLSMAVNKEPYGVTVNFGYDDNYLYFHSSSKGKKVEMIEINPEVSFEIHYGHKVYENKKACNWGTRYRSIIGKGKAELLEGNSDKINGLKEIMRKYSGTSNHEFNEKMLVHTNVYRISLDNVTAKNNKFYWEIT